MKRLLSLFAIILITNFAFAQPISMRPNWTYNTPEAEDNTYEYYVSKGIGKTEKEARTDAYILAVKEAQSRVGVGANSTEIFKAFQDSDKEDFNVVASHYEIPMKEVCNFSEKNGDQWYYYQLLQVAVSGNITPKFKPFAGDCYDFSKAKELYKILKYDFREEKKVRNREETDKLYVDGLNVMRYGHNLSKETVEDLFWGTRSYKIYKKSYNCDRGWLGLSIVGSLVLVSGLCIFASTDFRDFPDNAFITSMAFFAVSIPMITWGFCKSFDVVEKNKIRRAVRIYNRNHLQANYSSQLNLGLNGYGISMTYKF